MAIDPALCVCRAFVSKIVHVPNVFVHSIAPGQNAPVRGGSAGVAAGQRQTAMFPHFSTVVQDHICQPVHYNDTI